jgi:hypothetical protein
MPDVEVEIIEDDVPSIREVDAKLVALAQKFHCNVLTTDYNLNRVAQIQGVRVLNVNELSNAIRPVVLPGEELVVRVVQPGKERNQGVGYLADGTMIVVENGDKLIGQDVVTEVTRVFQTVAGKMIFAVPRNTPVAERPVDTLTPDDPAPKAPQTPKTPPAPKAAAAGEPGDAKGDHNRTNKRFGRNRHRATGQANGNGANAASTTAASANAAPPAARPTRRDDIEGRIIAATNKPRPE